MHVNAENPDWTAAEAGLYGLISPSIVEKLRAVHAFVHDDGTPGEDDPYIAQLAAALHFIDEAAVLPDGAERFEAWRDVYPYLAEPAVDTVELTDALAAAAHRNQRDKSGAEYIGHPRAVAAIVARDGGSLAQQMAALLHDVVEDTAATLPHLADLGVPDDVRELVNAMTHRPGEPRAHYLERVKATPGAALIKRSDIAHNTSPERMALLDGETRERLERKYAEALAVLAG
ncbi:HD domain-containing protein [Phytomonospora sp. NPDC050363]|uniref:HD domain-containing protein n=1 Tax=Phytomonospora sp. NPDC050363 TaxID=3155642 RepID=UPI0033D88939